MKSLTQATLLLRSSTTHSYINTTTQELRRLGGSASHSFSSSSSSCPEDKEQLNRNVKVSVLWDLRNCSVPNGVNALKVSQNITTAIRANGIKGPVTITAFADFGQISKSLQDDLCLTGVFLSHIPCGGEDISDRSHLTDLLFWASQNPPPAHLFLISGDKDFAYILHRLRMNNYNILLANKDTTPSILCSAASIMWPWCQLARGENFTGKFINEPPDGHSESWYSHNRKLLVDSTPDMGPPTCMQAECSPDTVFDSKPRAIRLATIKQTGKVSQSTSVQALAHQYAVGGSKFRAVPISTKNKILEVVNSYPKGVDSSVLRVELLRRNILDKDLYGHGKFSLFLKSLDSVLKLESTASRIFVHGIQQKVAEPVGLPEPFERVHQENVARPLGQLKDTKLVNSKLRPIADSEARNVDKSRNVPKVVNDRENVTTTGVDKKSSVTAYSPGKVDPSPVLPKENVVHLTEGHLGPMEQNDLSTDVGVFRRMWRTVFGHNSDASNTESNHLTEVCSTGDSFDKEEPEQKSVSGSFSSSNLYQPVSNGEVTRKIEVKAKPSQRVGMIRKIVDWCRFWKNSTSPYSTSGNFGEEETQVNNQSGSNKLFSDVAFCEELLSFLHTNKGASLISQNMTRVQMAQQLQKEGPPHLNTLSTADIIDLVNLLISEKKWIEESSSKIFPFKLIHSGQASSSPSNSSNVKGKDAPTEACSDNSSNVKGKDAPTKSEILEDCQNLVTEMFREQPEGFNMSTLKSSFRRRYGYDLDYQRLGYGKLAAMLQTFPGVDIGFDFVLPSKMSSNIVIPYSMENDNDNDGMWQELGPISETKSKKNSPRPVINGGANEDNARTGFDDFSEEFSDSEEDVSDGNSHKQLLHILNRSEYSRVDLKPSSPSVFQSRGLNKPRKTISFVSDQGEDDKGKAVNRILGTMEKSSESRLQR